MSVRSCLLYTSYFELIKNKEELEIDIKIKKDEVADLVKMKDRTIQILNGFSCPETTEALKNELKMCIRDRISGYINNN